MSKIKFHEFCFLVVSIAIAISPLNTLSTHMNTQPHTGDLYRHYKGQEYKIIGIGYHTETLEKVVIYQALYDSKEFGNNALWVRPINMFQETIIIDGKEMLRFTPITK
jgi:hypothetical protein